MDETYVNKIDSLAVKMDTQFGLHERYTDAFLRVATDIRLLVRQVEGLQEMGEQDAREVYKQLLSIATEMDGLEKNVDSLKSDLKQQLLDYREITERFTLELLRYRELISPKLGEMTTAVGDLSKAQDNLGRAQGVTDAKMVEKIDIVLDNSKKTLETVTAIQTVVGCLDPEDEDSKTLSISLTKVLQGIRRWRAFLWTIGISTGTVGFLWGLWQALLQLGILSQQWLPHAK